MMTSDEQLMLEFQKGSEDAFTELFQRYRQPVYGFFRRRLENAARAEQLAQETFVAVLRGEADTAAPKENPEAALWVRRAVEQLDASEREIVLLREYEGLSYEEISALLRVPVNTVRSRLFRARMALKDLLVPQAGEA
jgi:RNA polymerase sigma-70 factor (ECF subfamily)